MNLAHVHLLLNHIPVIAIPVGLLFLIHSLWTGHIPTRRFAYLVLLLVSVSIIPVFLTGEPAEEIVEHLPGVSETFIEPHEEAGKISLVLTLATGLSSLFAFFTAPNGTRAKIARNAVLATAILAMVSLAYTANLGGKIRHTELRGDATQPSEH